jgi:hypothetical protein
MFKQLIKDVMTLLKLVNTVKGAAEFEKYLTAVIEAQKLKLQQVTIDPTNIIQQTN